MTDHYILCVVTFCFKGTLAKRKKTSCENPGNIMKLELLIKDMKIEVPCKLLSFNRALIIKY